MPLHCPKSDAYTAYEFPLLQPGTAKIKALSAAALHAAQLKYSIQKPHRKQKKGITIRS